MLLRQSTAATLTIGPILDANGAEYTGAVIGDISISKNGTLTALASAATLTHSANGIYSLALTTGNTDTLGRLQLVCNKSTYQMPLVGANVVPAMVYDSLVDGTDYLQSDIVQLNGSTQNADRMPIAVNSNRTIQISGGGSNHIFAAIHNAEPDSIPAGALTEAAIAEIQSGLATTANQTIIIDRVSYSLTALVGACSDAGTAAETYTLSIGGSTFTVDHAGLDATGNRGTVTLSKV